MIKHFNKEYPSLEGPEVQNIQPPADYKYTQQDIEEVLDILYDNALQIAQSHSDSMERAGRGITPYAYRACTSYTAIEIILQLQKELASAYSVIDSFESDDSTSRRW